MANLISIPLLELSLVMREFLVEGVSQEAPKLIWKFLLPPDKLSSLWIPFMDRTSPVYAFKTVGSFLFPLTLCYPESCVDLRRTLVLSPWGRKGGFMAGLRLWKILYSHNTFGEVVQWCIILNSAASGETKSTGGQSTSGSPASNGKLCWIVSFRNWFGRISGYPFDQQKKMRQILFREIGVWGFLFAPWVCYRWKWSFFSSFQGKKNSLYLSTYSTTINHQFTMRFHNPKHI